jgi:succinyl-diaminopimelate desuccinylase
MKNYFLSEEMPSCGFSPDADFPIINSEMGITIFKINKKFRQVESSDGGIMIKSIKGGNRPNMVPDNCECELDIQKNSIAAIENALSTLKQKQDAKIELVIEDKKCIVKSYGVSAHGSTPEKGINAISQLVSFLSMLPLCTDEKTEFVRFMNDSIGMETDGTSFGLFMEDEVSGKLVFNLGVFELNEEHAEATINIRYPVTKTRDDVYGIIDRRIADAGLEYQEIAGKAPLYVPADNFLVKKLSEVYERVTGEKTKLISIGGGTYSRAIKNAVAFGPLFPGRPELAHQKDEYIDVDDLIKCTKIYAEAICELVK